MLNDKTLLITGGTGSFNQKFVEIVLKKYSKIKKIDNFFKRRTKTT